MTLTKSLNLKTLTDDQLMTQTKIAVDVDIQSATNVVRHFKEVFERELYLALGYGSLWLFAVKEFKYDPSSAQRRVNAVELSIAVPGLLERIDNHELCLQSAADIQTFLNMERGRKRPYSNEQKIALVDRLSGLSSREIQKELASLNPKIDFKESKTYISKDRLRVTYTTLVTVEDKLERIKQLRSSVNPYMTREDLNDYMADLVLEAIDPLKKAERREMRKEKRAHDLAKSKVLCSTEGKLPAQEVDAASVLTRSSAEVLEAKGFLGAETFEIEPRDEVVSEFGEVQLAIDFEKLSNVQLPAQVLALENASDGTALEIGTVITSKTLRTRNIKADDDGAVRLENQDQGCVFTSFVSGRRCGSKHQVQLDHVTEYSRGGANARENLQILCARHNRFRYRLRQGPSYLKSPSVAYA